MTIAMSVEAQTWHYVIARLNDGKAVVQLFPRQASHTTNRACGTCGHQWYHHDRKHFHCIKIGCTEPLTKAYMDSWLQHLVLWTDFWLWYPSTSDVTSVNLMWYFKTCNHSLWRGIITKKRCNESQRIRRFWAQKPGSTSQEERSQCHPQPHGMRQLQPMRLVSVVTMKWVTGNATIGTSWPGLQDYDLSEWGSLPFLLLPSYASEKVASISHRNCLISFDQCKGQAVMVFPRHIFGSPLPIASAEGTPRPQPRGVSKYPCFRIRHCLARSSPAWWLHKGYWRCSSFGGIHCNWIL